jgi:hypothetical protein
LFWRSGVVFAQEIGERLVKQGFDGAVCIGREVLDAPVFFRLDNERQAPLSGPRGGKVWPARLLAVKARERKKPGILSG